MINIENECKSTKKRSYPSDIVKGIIIIYLNIKTKTDKIIDNKGK